MRKSLYQLKTIADQEEARLYASEKAGRRLRTFRGQCPMYYSCFSQYFTWVIAKIPFIQRHDTSELHLNLFGPPLKLHVVVDFLEELTGEKFEALFGCKAGRSQYQYLDDLIVEALQMQGIQDLSGEEAKKVGIEPQNVKRAREWLSEQIETEKEIARRDLSAAVSAEPGASDNSASPSTPLPVDSPTHASRKSTRLSYRQVALLHIYQEILLENATAGQVARDARYDSPTSGRQLMRQYNLLDRGEKGRTMVQGKVAVNNMCNDIAAVIPHLPEDKRQQAEKELKELELKK